MKTGIYYLRSQAKTSAQKFSVDLEKSSSVISGNTESGSGTANKNSKENGKENVKNKNNNNNNNNNNNIQEKEEPECIMCSS